MDATKAWLQCLSKVGQRAKTIDMMCFVHLLKICKDATSRVCVSERHPGCVFRRARTGTSGLAAAWMVVMITIYHSSLQSRPTRSDTADSESAASAFVLLRPGSADANTASAQMGKHRLSIAKKSLLAAKPHRVKPKRIKQPSQPVRSQGGDRAEDPSTTAAQRHHKQRETRVAPQVQVLSPIASLGSPIQMPC